MSKKTEQISTSSLPLVAIDFGSSGIRAMAATRVGEDLFRVLGVEYSQKYDCVKTGIVTNTNNAAFMIGETLRKLANRIQVESLPSVFVTVGGAGMRVISVPSKRDLGRKCAITTGIIEEMKAECKDKIERKYTEIAVLGMVPSYFILDGVKQDYVPTEDQKATNVEACFIAFYGSKQLETHLLKSFELCRYTIEQSFVRPDALVSAFACEDGPDVLSNGCAVLDLGAQTTTLSVYKENTYHNNMSVARGGDNITQAIAHYGVDFATAEKIKCEYCCAMSSQVEEDKKLSVTINGDKVVFSLKSLANLVNQKLDEILIPLFDELNKEADSISVLYITGGGSMLSGIDEYIQQHTSVPVMYGAHDRLLVEDTNPTYFEPTYASLVGTLLLANDYRATHESVVVKKSFIKRVSDELLTLFSGTEDITQ